MFLVENSPAVSKEEFLSVCVNATNDLPLKPIEMKHSVESPWDTRGPMYLSHDRATPLSPINAITIKIH